jgi:predicted nucleic acid-binding protein
MKGAVQFRADYDNRCRGTDRAHSACDEALAQRYRAVFESWRVVDLTTQIAETAARLRASLKLKLADAVQAASAVAVNADALVTHDRDFSRRASLRVIS